MRFYFDACVWIDHLWGIREDAKPKKRIADLVQFVEDNNHIVVSSVFLNTEISSHFKDWYILQKIIRAGYSYRELSKLKKQKKWNILTKEEEVKINENLQHISQLPWVESVVLNSLKRDDLEIFSILTLEYYLDFADAFHILIAMIENCRFLVTRDEEMRRSARLFLRDFSFQDDMDVLRPSEILNI